jgi:hypothetical protein
MIAAACARKMQLSTKLLTAFVDKNSGRMPPRHRLARGVRPALPTAATELPIPHLCTDRKKKSGLDDPRV